MNTPIFDSALLPSDREFDRMKSNLFELIEEAGNESAPHLVPVTTKRKRPYRRAAWATVFGVAAATLAVMLVATNVFGPHAATAEAAEVLHSAALAAIKSSDPVVGPGQFLKVETTEVALSFYRESAYEQPQSITLYVPADRSSTWLLGRQDLPPGKSYGDAKSNINNYWSDPDRGTLRLYQAPGGNFGGRPYGFPGEIAKMPRDGDALLRYLYDHAVGSHSKEAIFSQIKEALRTGLVPADLRAAMYQALANLPGVYLAQGQTNLDGQAGVAISRKEPSRPWVDQIIIDPTTGLLIGVCDVVATGQWDPVPAGTVADWTAVKTSVVDQLPAGPYAVMPPDG